MKIVSYNISSCTQKKVDFLFTLDADVYVVPEMARDINIPDSYFMHWAGNNKSKGLGIIYKNAIVPECYDESLPYAIPLRYEDLFILAFWPTKIDKSKSYTQIATQILNHYSEQLKSRDSIVTGDFNLFHKNDKPNKDADILEVDKLLQSFGLKSAYHELRGESFGSETKKTYFHQYKEDNPFFLDYTYYTQKNLTIKKYELLPWEKEFSDHRGQLIEL